MDGGEIIDTNPKPIIVEEDVPADFFDDFLNQDFMAGLDVVDAWDEELADIRKQQSIQVGENEKDNENKIGTKKEYEDIKNKENEKLNFKGECKKDSEGAKINLKECVPKNEKGEETLRRDPDKTKRDIEKDKLKCAKNKEIKVMSERLKVVETGLVPPGMELEIDLDEIVNQTNSKQYRPIIKESISKENAYVCGSHKKKSVELPNQRISKISTPEIKSHELSCSVSDGREMRSSESSKYKKRSSGSSKRRHIRSRTRSRNRDVLAKRRSHGRDKRLHRVRRLSRSRSRERNLESKKKMHSSINESPPRKRNKTFLEELDDKLSKTSEDSKIFKEIQQKINSGPFQHNIMQHSIERALMMQNQEQFKIVPNPASALIPQTYFPLQLPDAVYDEQFFVGQSAVPNPFQHDPHPYPQQNIPCSSYELRNPVSNIGPTLKPVNINSNIQEQPRSQSLEKLFAENRISLTDYLRSSVSGADRDNPMGIQNKIKVLSRCQDAIKELSRDGKLNAHFTFKKVNFVKEKSVEVKYQSPLKRTPSVRFPFTAPKSKEENSPFAQSLNRVLAKLGIAKETVPSPKSSPAILKNNNNTDNLSNIRSKSSVNRVSVLTQADLHVRCEKCEKRSALNFKNKSNQTVPVMTFSTGTQVSEEDFRPKENDFLKNKSLAYLTPAQLMRQDKTDSNFSSNKYTTTEDYSRHPQNIYLERNANTKDFFNRGNLNQPVTFNAPYKSFDGRPLQPGDPRFSMVPLTPSGTFPPNSQNYPGNSFNPPMGYNILSNTNRPTFNPLTVNNKPFGYLEDFKF